MSAADRLDEWLDRVDDLVGPPEPEVPLIFFRSSAPRWHASREPVWVATKAEAVCGRVVAVVSTTTRPDYVCLACRRALGYGA